MAEEKKKSFIGKHWVKMLALIIMVLFFGGGYYALFGLKKP
jgi:hypothetical protein